MNKECPNPQLFVDNILERGVIKDEEENRIALDILWEYFNELDTREDLIKLSEYIEEFEQIHYGI
jgi:hypothetical protein